MRLKKGKCMKKIDNFIGYFGGYWFLLFFLVERVLLYVFEKQFSFLMKGMERNSYVELAIWIIPLFFSFFAYYKNVGRKKRGHKYFGFFDLFCARVEEEETKAFYNATYPPVEKKLLANMPKDLVIGKQNKKYVNIPIERDGINILGMGTPGAGKSVLIKNWLIAQMYKSKLCDKKARKKSLDYNYFLVDVDGLIYKELYSVESEYDVSEDGDIPIRVIEPSNRYSYGWDVYYLLRNCADDDTLKLKVVTDIAEAIVPESGDNPYFFTNARKILTGILIWGINKNQEFVKTIQLITRTNLDELLSKAVKEARACGWGMVLDKLASFTGKANNESVQDIEATLKQYLDVFASYPDIVFALETNEKKTSPDDLNDGKTNIIFSIETSMLNVYQPFFRLVVMQMLRHIETKFDVNDMRNTIYIIDEAARVGKIDDVFNTMAIARKYHTSIALFFQDISQFHNIYGKEKAKVIQNLCELKLFLSGSGDKETVEYLDEIVGDYVSERKNYQRSGLLNEVSEVKYSEEKRPIISGKSFTSLRDKDELILIFFGKYYRIKKLFYFKDKFLCELIKK